MRLPFLSRFVLTSVQSLALVALPFEMRGAQASTIPAVPTEISLREAIDLAIRYSSRHRDSYVAVQDARSRRRTTGELTRVTYGGFATHTDGTDRDATLDTGADGRADVSRPSGTTATLRAALPWASDNLESADFGLTMAVPLTRGRGRASTTRVSLDRSDLSLRNQELSHFLNQQSLVQQVVTAYFGAVRAEEQVKVQERAVERSRQLVEDEKKRLEAGLSIEVDLTSAQIRLSRDEESLANQVESYRSALDDLILLLGLPVGALPRLTEPVPYNPQDVNLEASIAEALANRPEMEQLRIQKVLADIDLRVAMDQKRPRADILANLGFLGLSILTGGSFTKVLSSVLGVRVDVPVSKKALREGQLQSERQIDLLDYLDNFQQQSIVNEVRGLVRAAETARRNIDLNTTNLQFAQRKLQIAQRLIEEGLRTNRDLLDAQQEVTSAETSVLTTKVNYELTLVSLRRALGQDLLAQYGAQPLELPERPVMFADATTREPGATAPISSGAYGRDAYPASLR
jgi:outer membrane protein TolC